MNRKSNSDNSKVVYQLSLESSSLGLISPYLFIERLKDLILIKIPNIKTDILYNPKDKGKSVIELTCFCSKELPDYQINNLQEEIAFIAATLHDELLSRIEDARRSVA